MNSTGRKDYFRAFGCTRSTPYAYYIEGHKARKGFALAYKARRDFSIVAVLIVLMQGPLYLFIAYPVLTRTAKSHFEHKFYHI